MKIIKTLFCVIFLILFGMVLYVRYDQKRFRESLRPPPMQPTEVRNTEMPPVPSVAEGKLNGVKQDISNSSIIDDVPNNALNHVHSEGTDVSPNNNMRDDTFETVDTQGYLDDFIEETEETAESLETKDTRSMAEIASSDPYKHIEFMRAGLVEKYGDTPEVNAFLALELKQFTADSMTGEELLRRSELLAEFYPHPDNIEALESTRKMVEHSRDKIFYKQLPGVLPENMIIIHTR